MTIAEERERRSERQDVTDSIYLWCTFEASAKMSYPVEVYIYDLSQGMAQQLGPQVGLPDLTGVWHTSIVVHGLEIFFGGGGIEHCPPGATMMGPPLEKKHLGETSVSSEAMTAHLVEVGRSS